MIQPGQKLKEGDYFRFGKVYEYRELLEIESPKHIDNEYHARLCDNPNWDGFYYNGIELLFTSKRGRYKTKYDFPDFKQLCENTFKPVPPKLKYITDGKDPH